MSDHFITIPHFAERVDASAKTAKRIVESAGLPTFRIGGQLRLRESDVDGYLEGQRIEPATPAETSLKTLVHAAVERAKKRRES